MKEENKKNGCTTSILLLIGLAAAAFSVYAFFETL